MCRIASFDAIRPDQSEDRLMRVAICLPRKMHFGPEGATAIDLCARDTIEHSALKNDTIVFGEAIDAPFASIDYRGVPRGNSTAQRSYATALADAMAAVDPDLIVVHQHVPSATAIRIKAAGIPVLLYRHNLTPAPASFFPRWMKTRQLSAFAGVVVVSDFLRERFVADFPKLEKKVWRVHNGLDYSGWNPATEREKTVLFVGRAVAAKGGLEAATAIAAALTERPDWRAQFILSRLDDDDAYYQRIIDLLAPLGERVIIETDRPHSHVQQAYERAAIALVPSIFEEPFGRTAIEAYAGGAALITSGRGGLREICEGAGEIVDPEDTAAFTHALLSLIDNPDKRADIAARGKARGRAQFDVTVSARKLDSVYEQCISRK
ncbi:glycosyltransferase family 4 protein [Breoghania sp.]|uniref:glycosyltransferase family 4 protein n=1 Tax=Breoghania sp. TaxID=2065378 RepID=UPI0029C9DBD9|nr:glycosyltransferase family 4 protein [Breoghania sp.]